MNSPFPADVAFVLRERVAQEETAAGDALLPAERALLAAESSPKRIADFALGRACGREALREAGAWTEGTPPAILRSGRLPVWPPGYVGSLAHTHGAAVAVAAPAARYRGLGVDVESRGRDTAGVAARILRPEEQAVLANRPREWVTLWFCAKESVYKALHPVTGVYLGFQDVRVHAPDPPLDPALGGGGTLEWELLTGCGAQFPEGTRGPAGWSAEGGWIVAGVWLPR